MVGSSNLADWAVGAGGSPLTSEAYFRPTFSLFNGEDCTFFVILLQILFNY